MFENCVKGKHFLRARERWMYMLEKLQGQYSQMNRKITSDKMTIDEMIENKMTVDKMTVDKMTVDKMTVDKMTVDKGL